MKVLAIVLSLFLSATAVFAGPEKKPASEQAPESAKASENPAAAGAKKGARKDSTDSSEKAVSHRALVAPATRKESAEPAESLKPEPPVWLFEIEEKGNNVTFRKKTPFGVTSYSKPKNELTEEERGLVERYRAAKADPSLPDDAKQPARPTMPIPKKQER
jgi:hypothetical protein